MTLAVQNLLRSYEELSENERRDLVFEILRRCRSIDIPPVSEEELVSLVDELFQKLDKHEATSQKLSGRNNEELLWSQFSLAQALRGMEDEDGPVYTRDDLKEVWLTEAERRARELDAGTVKPIPAEEVRRKVQSLLR